MELILKIWKPKNIGAGLPVLRETPRRKLAI
jgi:hypothetical protein